VHTTLSSDDAVFRETSARYRAVEPSSGSNVIPRRARPGLAGLRPHNHKAGYKGVFGGSATKTLLAYPYEPPYVPTALSTVGVMGYLRSGYSRNAFEARGVASSSWSSIPSLEMSDPKVYEPCGEARLMLPRRVWVTSALSFYVSSPIV